MPPFEYVPFNPAPYAASIGDLLARQNDPTARAAIATANASARAREVSGQAWGRAIEQVGQLPAQIMQQQRQMQEAQQLGALRQSEIEQNNQRVAAQKRVTEQQTLLGSLLPTFTKADPLTGLSDVDHQGLVSAFVAKGGDPSAAEKYLQTAASTTESLDKIASAKRTTANATAEAVGRQAKDATDAGDFLARIDHLTVAGAIPTPVRDKFAQEVQQAGPDGWKAVQQRYVDWADSVVKPLTVKKDEKVITGVSGKTLVDNTDPNEGGYTINGQRFRKDGTPIGALVPQQTPKSLEDQYLAAIAAGKNDAAALIRQTWEDKAKASRDPAATAQLAAIRSITQQEAQARLDERDTTSPKNQQKFEQEYRTVLTRGLSSRSGGLGLEDAKVQQANHLISIFEQNYDPKTGDYNIPRVQLNELALGLARLTSPGGQAGEGMLKEFQQRTAKGDLAGALTYLTGQPIPANTQGLTQMLKESIERQGKTAETNRENEMGYLRGLAPTDLSEDRRQKLEANSLGALRQTRLIQNDKTGERKLQVSTDGGKTWK